MVSYSIGNFYRNIVKTFKSLPTESQFLDQGKLTPQQFVIAGQQLTHRCPTWQWQSSAPGYQQSHFPPQNQFLITRGVPCRKRISQIGESEVIERQTEDGWLITQESKTTQQITQLSLKQEEQKKNSDEEIPDFADIQGEDLVDENALQYFSKGYMTAQEPEQEILRTRVYDLSITYDTYYLTPRLWLVGYDQNMNPLTPDQMFQDIMDDYAHKTVTIERHPCTGTNQVSIHPCNHAKMMKHFIDLLAANGSEAQVHHALFVYLKFLSSVVPTIEYDFTVDLALDQQIQKWRIIL